MVAYSHCHRVVFQQFHVLFFEYCHAGNQCRIRGRRCSSGVDFNVFPVGIGHWAASCRVDGRPLRQAQNILVGNAIFGFVSLLIVIVPGFYPAVVLRFVQGLGSAMIMASAPALIASAFETSRRGFVLGIQTTFTYIGLSLAPLLGGLLTQVLGWKSLFVFNP